MYIYCIYTIYIVCIYYCIYTLFLNIYTYIYSKDRDKNVKKCIYMYTHIAFQSRLSFPDFLAFLNIMKIYWKFRGQRSSSDAESKMKKYFLSSLMHLLT